MREQDPWLSLRRWRLATWSALGLTLLGLLWGGCWPGMVLLLVTAVGWGIRWNWPCPKCGRPYEGIREDRFHYWGPDQCRHCSVRFGAALAPPDSRAG